ncbi:hypothetical protein GCM10007384_26040 [Aquimarina muelleri]|uniref:Uncharacterized protein n=2 Tax=Aquimarina muelleri TaxID=279356 RepID=A0A918JVM4_9FLAO|nr:hypothetical protein GCM10007384_26040 [Aquimarina muelleri]
MKTAGIHVLLHTDDKDHALHCTVCDHAIIYNATPLIFSDSQDFTINIIEPVAQREITKNYRFIISNTIGSDQLFSRPPPSTL